MIYNDQHTADGHHRIPEEIRKPEQIIDGADCKKAHVADTVAHHKQHQGKIRPAFPGITKVEINKAYDPITVSSTSSNN